MACHVHKKVWKLHKLPMSSENAKCFVFQNPIQSLVDIVLRLGNERCSVGELGLLRKGNYRHAVICCSSLWPNLCSIHCGTSLLSCFLLAGETNDNLWGHDLLLRADAEPLRVYSTSPEAVYHRYSQQKWKSKHNLLLTTSVAAQLSLDAL